MNLSKLNFGDIWKPILVSLAVLFLYATVLSRLVGHWWTDENYSHGLLVPFIISYIVWINWEELKEFSKDSLFWVGGGIVILALIMLLGGTLGAELFVQRISFLLMLIGIVVYFFGAKILQYLAIPFILLLLAIPIPQIIFNKIAFPLQIYASQIAVWGIRLFEVPTVRKGNVIEILPQGAIQVISLEVVEACSGIRSLMTLMTLALILVYFTKENSSKTEESWLSFLNNRDFWRGFILMLSAIPIAVITNAGRVTATGVLTYYYGKKATEGFSHDLAGWLVYLVALALLFALNLALKKILTRKNTDSKAKQEIDKLVENQIGSKNSLWLIIGILLAGGLFINWFEQRGEVETERQNLKEFHRTLGDWKQKGSDTRFSKETESVLKTTDYIMRDYEKNGRYVNLYIGYYASQKTGATYHSPQNCLPGAGWEMKHPKLVEVKTPSGKTFMANHYIIESGDHKAIMIYWYQGRGRTIASEYRDKVYTVWDSVVRRRSDGSMVRVMTWIGNSEEDATAAAIDLAAQTAERLSKFVPE